jgi:hypothetical protein
MGHTQRNQKSPEKISNSTSEIYWIQVLTKIPRILDLKYQNSRMLEQLDLDLDRRPRDGILSTET